MPVLSIARRADLVLGTVLGLVFGLAVMFELTALIGDHLVDFDHPGWKGAFYIGIGSIYGAYLGSTFVGIKFFPGAIAGAISGIVMAVTVVVIETLFGPTALGFTVTVYAGTGISFAKLLPGLIVIPIVLYLIPDIHRTG